MPTATANAHFQKPGIGSETDWGETLNADLDALDTFKQTHDVNLAALNTNATLVASGHNATTPAAVDAKISLEVYNARGSALTLDARLDVALNENGSLKSTTAAADQWIDTATAGISAYTSAATFTVTGADVTAVLLPGKPLKIETATYPSGLYYRVKNATYSAGDTVVTVWDGDPAIPNEAFTGTTVYYYSGGEINYRDNDRSALTPGAIPGDWIQTMRGGEFVMYYYVAHDSGNAASYSSPFATGGGTPATTNTGRLARIEYESGMKVGFTRSSSTAKVTVIDYRVSIGGTDTLIETQTFTRDGTTGKITNLVRT